MFDLKYLIDNLQEVKKDLSKRPGDFSFLDKLPSLVEKRNKLINDTDAMKQERNNLSKKIGEYKREKKDATPILEKVAGFGKKIEKNDEKISKLQKEIEDLLIETPNIPDKKVPLGKDETDNVVVKEWGAKKEFGFKPLEHHVLNEKLGMFDFERAAKVSGARFVFDIGAGARLERALIQFMLDTHVDEGGYNEAIPPYLISQEALYSTGKFPKFMDEVYHIEGENLYLNATAEIPMIDMYRNEILKEEELPIKFAAYSAAFRPESGAAGRDTKGLMRMHQFHKVELIKFTTPEQSEKELELMVNDAEKILQKLELPYRIVKLCGGDLGFSMSITYDLEVFLPGQDRYREISSVSNAKDYQSRRGMIRYRNSETGKTEYVHTLNGSGLAVGRTALAIMENYQNEDGSITIPKVLRKYMNNKTKIEVKK